MTLSFYTAPKNKFVKIDFSLNLKWAIVRTSVSKNKKVSWGTNHNFQALTPFFHKNKKMIVRGPGNRSANLRLAAVGSIGDFENRNWTRSKVFSENLMSPISTKLQTGFISENYYGLRVADQRSPAVPTAANMRRNARGADERTLKPHTFSERYSRSRLVPLVRETDLGPTSADQRGGSSGSRSASDRFAANLLGEIGGPNDKIDRKPPTFSSAFLNSINTNQGIQSFNNATPLANFGSFFYVIGSDPPGGFSSKNILRFLFAFFVPNSPAHAVLPIDFVTTKSIGSRRELSRLPLLTKKRTENRLNWKTASKHLVEKDGKHVSSNKIKSTSDLNQTSLNKMLRTKSPKNNVFQKIQFWIIGMNPGSLIRKSSSIRKVFDSFPTLRFKHYKIPFIPIILCIVPYILFLGIRQSFWFINTQQFAPNQLLIGVSPNPTNFVINSKKIQESTLPNNAGQLSISERMRGVASQSENQTSSLNEVDGVLGIPSILSKLFVVWAIQQIASIRGGERKMAQKTEQSQQTKILFPNEIQVSLENLQGLSSVFPVLRILIESLNSTSPLREPTNLSTSPAKVSEPSGLILESFSRIKINEPNFPFVLKQSTSNDSKMLQFSRSNFKTEAPKGYLFVGPPGTGKTRLAQALAKEANVPLLCVSASEIQKQIEIGTRIGALRLRKIFETAREYAPCILFFDEIDAIGKTRGNQSFGTSDNQLLTEFLIQMDSFSAPPKGKNREGFVVIGTTNFLSQLDSAFIRSGRFDRIISMNLPSKKIRINILQSQALLSGRPKHGKKELPEKYKSEIPWNYLGYYTNGFSQAHLSRLINESFLYSCKNKMNPLEKKKDSLLQTFKSEQHTFESLQHGFNRIQAHRKNFLFDN